MAVDLSTLRLYSDAWVDGPLRPGLQSRLASVALFCIGTASVFGNAEVSEGEITS